MRNDVVPHTSAAVVSSMGGGSRAGLAVEYIIGDMCILAYHNRLMQT